MAGASLSHRIHAAEAQLDQKLKGRVNHSVCRWCYNDIPLEDLCKAAKEIGIDRKTLYKRLKLEAEAELVQ